MDKNPYDLTIEESLEYYETLGFKPGKEKHPSLKEIKSAYKRLVKEYHPDLHPGKEDQFKKVHFAYCMLIDPSFRNKQIGTKVRSLNLTIAFMMSFEEAFFGGNFLFNINVEPPEIEENKKILAGTKSYKVKTTIESFPIHIQPGAFDMQPLTLKGKGFTAGPYRGDVIIRFIIVPHKKFRPEGNLDIVIDEQVPLSVMLKGGECTVATMWGTKKIIIPPGTKPEDKITIPHYGVDKMGSQHVIIHPLYPSTEELKESDEWKEFKINWDMVEEKDEEMEKNQDKYEELTEPDDYVFPHNEDKHKETPSRFRDIF